MAQTRKQEQPKNCETCGATMYRKRYSGLLEDTTAFNKRKFCTLSCANSRAEVKTGTLLWRARRHRKNCCEACGHGQSLHVHHIDQDQTNNRPENLQTLCKHCHNFWHTAAKRRGLAVAGKMPSLGFQQQFPTGHTDLKPSETP